MALNSLIGQCHFLQEIYHYPFDSKIKHSPGWIFYHSQDVKFGLLVAMITCSTPALLFPVTFLGDIDIKKNGRDRPPSCSIWPCWLLGCWGSAYVWWTDKEWEIHDINNDPLLQSKNPSRLACLLQTIHAGRGLRENQWRKWNRSKWIYYVFGIKDQTGHLKMACT